MTNSLRWGIALTLIVIVLAGTGVIVCTMLVKYPPAGQWPWPVACTTRGCITLNTWTRHYEVANTFSRFSEQPTPTPEDVLTTLVRQYLIHKAFVATPVAPDDAVRYREEVLHLTDEVMVREASGLSMAEYDEFVIMPLLEQEALRAEMRVESLDELFVQLAGQRTVWIPPLNLWWDPVTARVVRS